MSHRIKTILFRPYGSSERNLKVPESKDPDVIHGFVLSPEEGLLLVDDVVMVTFRNLLFIILPLLLRYICYYRPQRSCGKVIFLHLPFILFKRGRVVWQTPLGRHLLGRHTTRQTPPFGQTTLADTGMHSCFKDLTALA